MINGSALTRCDGWHHGGITFDAAGNSGTKSYLKWNICDIQWGQKYSTWSVPVEFLLSYTSSITAEHVCLFGRYSQEGWWTLCTYFKMCIIVLWGTAEDNLRLDGRAGIQRVLSALSDQLAEGNDLNVNDLLACLTLSTPAFLCYRLFIFV